ncbi:MAG: TonB-dependent receptor [Woeseiaceae bacterium]|nr:TonB-dependent receptor [Woeseiaceae bacterium]MDX2608070.1 TonB-dependent receptor [Woeseiaceae bacterium]
MITNSKTTEKCVTRFGAALVAVATGFIFSMPANAQDDSIFDEIVVTVQKREQNIMDVPVAVTALTGADIQASGIKDVFDLQQNVPSLIVGQSQTATTSNFQIRSVGSTANNFGVESSVGLYVDGVYRSRQSSMINDLVDVEAVEVLRGPQGTLLGKNTSAGAISVRTVRPGYETDAFFEVTAGDMGLAKVSGAANFPINDELAFRGTIFATQRDGYIDDLRLGENVYNDRDRQGVRLQLAHNEPSDDLNWRLIADYAKIDEICCVGVGNVDNLYSRNSLSPNPATAVPGTDAAVLQLGGTVFTDYPYPQPFLDALAGFPGTIVTDSGFEDGVVAYNVLPESENQDSGLSFELNKTLGSGMTFTSITGYRSFDTVDFSDVDFTDVALLERTNDATQESLSQEFRLAGEFGEGSHYVAGLYYFGQEIVNRKSTNDAGALSVFLNLNPNIISAGDGVDLVASIFGAAGFQPAGSPAVLAGTTALDVVKQDHSGYAAFAQVDFAVSDELTFTLGARYTDETKDIDAVYTQSLPSSSLRPDFGALTVKLCSLDAACAAFLPPGSDVFNPADPLASLPVFEPFFTPGWGIFVFDPLAPRPDIRESVSDSQVTGTAKVTWFATDATMFYASYATGFKSGGTNDDRIAPVFDVVFGPETSESIEIGFKGDVGPVRLAVTLYDTQYEDFQANSFTGTGFNLQNAGDLDTQGIEIEFDWRPFESTKVQGYFAHNEGEYKSFVNGTCRDAFQFHTQMPDPGLVSGLNPILDAERCDRSGDPLPYNPEDQFFVSLTQDIEVGDDIVYFRGEFSHYSKQFTDGDDDPFTEQDAYEIVNLRIGYIFTDWNAELTLWARNITDERYFHGSFDRPAQVGSINSYPGEPSSVGVTFRKGFD